MTPEVAELEGEEEERRGLRAGAPFAAADDIFDFLLPEEARSATAAVPPPLAPPPPLVDVDADDWDDAVAVFDAPLPLPPAAA